MDYVQSVIGRLAGNSFLLKGWCITLTTALLGFAFTRSEAPLAVLGIIAVLSFWALDAYFLQQERAFRALFREVVSKRVAGFQMDPTPYVEKNLWKTMVRRALCIFYATLAFICVLVAAYLWSASALGQSVPSLPGTSVGVPR